MILPRLLHRRTLLCVIHLAAVVLLFAISNFAAAASENCSIKADSPYSFPIVRKGDPDLIGISVNKVVAFSTIKGQWKKIRVQIDEVNSNGDYVLEGGMPFTKASDDGIFDANDELALSGTDLGDDFQATDVPKDIAGTAKRVLKIRLCSKERFYGAALIVAQYEYASAIWSPMVALDVDKLEVASKSYRYNFRKDNPALLGEVFLRDATGTEFGIFSSSDFQLVLKLPWYLPDFTLTNSDFTSLIESWRTGPVRTIVAIGVKFKKFLSVFNFHLFSELVFYDEGFQIPTVIEFPFDAYRYLRPGSGIAYALSFPKGRQWPINTNLAHLPLQSAEQVIASGMTADFTEQFFALARRPEGSVKVMVRVGENARRMVPPPFYVQSQQFGETKWSKYWEWLGDMEGDFGVFLDISRVKKGRYDFGLDLLLSPKADESFEEYGQLRADWTQIVVPK